LTKKTIKKPKAKIATKKPVKEKAKPAPQERKPNIKIELKQDV